MPTIRGVKHVLWICGRPWTVEFCDGPVVHRGHAVLGICEEDTFTISVTGDEVNRLQQRTTLLHEWLHACLRTCTVPDPLPSDGEEAYVRSLEVAVYDSLRDSRNGWLRTFLLENDELLVS